MSRRSARTVNPLCHGCAECALERFDQTSLLYRLDAYRLEAPEEHPIPCDKAGWPLDRLCSSCRLKGIREEMRSRGWESARAIADVLDEAKVPQEHRPYSHGNNLRICPAWANEVVEAVGAHVDFAGVLAQRDAEIKYLRLVLRRPGGAEQITAASAMGGTVAVGQLLLRWNDDADEWLLDGIRAFRRGEDG